MIQVIPPIPNEKIPNEKILQMVKDRRKKITNRMEKEVDKIYQTKIDQTPQVSTEEIESYANRKVRKKVKDYLKVIQAKWINRD